MTENGQAGAQVFVVPEPLLLGAEARIGLGVRKSFRGGSAWLRLGSPLFAMEASA